MAAGLGYKEFTTGDVLTAADANGYLASQVVMVFASAAARTSAIASPQEGMIAYLKDTNAVEKYDGAAWVSVGGGGGGKVLQVVQSSYSTSKVIASTTLTDTDLTATITPSASTSKILVLLSQPFLIERDSQGVEGYGAILRGGTTIVNTTPYGFAYYYQPGSQADLLGVFAYHYLDSPATTSATTYKTQMRINATSLNGQVTANTFASTIILMEIGA
jgi:hypothetical protein